MSEAALLSYQGETLNALRHQRMTVAEKSRRIGFTYGLSFGACLIAAARTQAGGSDVLYMSYNQEITREFISYCARFAAAMHEVTYRLGESIIDDERASGHTIKAFRIDFCSGFKILALPSHPRSLRGHQGVVIIDEAAFIDDLDAVIRAAQPLLIWGGRIFVVSTHLGAENAFHRLLVDIRAGRKVGWNVMRVDLDDALRAGLFKRICAVTKQVWSQKREQSWRKRIIAEHGANAQQELFCIPDQQGLAWLQPALIERASRKVAVVRFSGAPPDHHTSPDAAARAMVERVHQSLGHLVALHGDGHDLALGADIGRSRDLTVIWALKRSGRKRETVFVLELAGVTFAGQWAIFDWLLTGWPGLDGAAIDATGIGAQMGEQLEGRLGSRAQAVHLSLPWYRTHTAPLKAAFEDGFITIPDDHQIIRDLHDVVVIDGIARIGPGRRRGSSGSGLRHGDAAIALMLAFAASRNAPPRYEFDLASMESEVSFD
ncbi:MAG: hypothetical protein AAF418_02445 [Pseudomonadota bacterium]